MAWDRTEIGPTIGPMGPKQDAVQPTMNPQPPQADANGTVSPPRRESRVGRLVAINGMLAVAVAGLTLAQNGRGGRDQPRDDEPVRARGEYTMVAAPTPAGDSDAVLIVDGVNQEVAVTLWDRTRQTMNVIGYRDLALDAKAQPGR